MGGTETRKPRVLSIDDDAAVRTLLSKILADAGFEVEASDGTQALDQIRRSRPSLVLLDVSGPGMNGFDICRRIKADRQLAAIPVVICTSESRKESLISAIRAGAEDYILKPFTADTVIRRVQRALIQSAPPPSTALADLRGAVRRPAGWQVSWSAAHLPGFSDAYKCLMLDISLRGMAIEFARCETCTGYLRGSVHPNCPFASAAGTGADGKAIEFVLSANRDVLLEVRGRIAHVFQPIDSPRTERVGVEFVSLTPECAAVIEKYVAGSLDL